MGFDWHRPLQTQHTPPREANLLDGAGPRGQRRVLILGDYAASLPRTDPRHQTKTVWLYEDDGTLDRAGDEWRLVEAAL